MIRVLACSILRAELEWILDRLTAPTVDVQIDYVDSALHMYPKRLEATLREQLHSGQTDMLHTHPRVLIFGDCCPGMVDLEKEGHVRVQGSNCMVFLLGKQRYRALIQEGAFLVQREWAIHWRRVFQEELGLKDSVLTQSFFGDMHSALVYLDTGVAAVPVRVLQEMADYTGLPYRVESVSLATLKQIMEEAMARLNAHGTENKGGS